MKLVKNFLFAVVLVCTLAVNTQAGEQDVPGYVPPPPPRATSGTENEYPPVAYDGGTTETSDNLFYEALAALLSMY